ncbi:MAG: hypothetical protein ACR2L2_07330 [Acidobacteriota bacterium]
MVFLSSCLFAQTGISHSLSLQEAQTIALRDNPQLKSPADEVRVKQADVVSAAMRLNPVFSFDGDGIRRLTCLSGFDFPAATAYGSPSARPGAFPSSAPQPVVALPTKPGSHGFQWTPALRQSLLFLGLQHGYMLTEEKTQRELGGPFFRDYFRSLSHLKGWKDGGRQFTNYLAHPMQGSFYGFIQVHNDPHGISQAFGPSAPYWKSRLKALAWSAAWSTQFELGPLSQASVGNVGLHKRKLTYVDLVITPTLGTALLISEDALDHYVTRWVERTTGKKLVINSVRVLLNPTRSCANMIRFRTPWHRDRK